ncbi:glycosyltransferase family 4 protein [Parvularcula sp. LCG005]|uniref:glycosyltransferase family 4 protein n=1 Tax=Parvularcula sp. LCG005 TaxID=3078805 RepID=UPI002941D419|nr:glycosyltransferase family 4 protein [Parvularcula sp. LCG005]WOI53658.1 glycosyltransferase family 4 protein [Parvularcula sp. LCG005]
MSAKMDLSGITILQVIPALETGGAERTTLEVGRAVVAAGGRSLVVSEGGPMVAQLEDEGSRHITMPAASKNPLTMWGNRGRLIDLVKREKVSVIHARSRAPAWSALGAARATGTPFVTTYHGIYRAKTALKRLYNSAMARGEVVIANSEYTAEAVRQSFADAPFFDPGRMVVIPRGADLSRFDPEQLDDARQQAALTAFGGEGAIRILLPGRLTEWKGQREMIAAARLLQEEGTIGPVRVVLVGSAQGRDDYEASLRREIEEAGLRDSVHIHGHWEDMPAAYDWAHIVVSASTRPEAFGRVSVEAQAMGRPVIATAHGGSLETIDPEKTGCLVPPGDAKAIATSVSRWATLTPTGRRKVAAAARARAVERFSIEAMTDATLSVYNSLTSQEGRPTAQSG